MRILHGFLPEQGKTWNDKSPEAKPEKEFCRPIMHLDLSQAEGEQRGPVLNLWGFKQEREDFSGPPPFSEDLVLLFC